MSAPRDDVTIPSEPNGGASVFEVAHTTVGALIPVDASDSPADDARGVRDVQLEEWFARAATGAASDEGDPPAREPVGAATLPQDAVVSRGSASTRAPGAGLCWRVRGRALALASVALLSVVVAVVMWSVGPSLISAPVPEVVPDASVPIDKLGDAVDRGLTVTITRQKRADARRRAVAQAQRRRTSERRDRVRPWMLAARHRAATRRRGAAHARTFARTPVSAVSSPCTRRISPRTRRGQFASRRSTCGPFDLC